MRKIKLKFLYCDCLLLLPLICGALNFNFNSISPVASEYRKVV